MYKIPDDVWDRYFNLFQIEIFDGIFLECKPSGYTHNDELIYSRFVIFLSYLISVTDWVILIFNKSPGFCSAWLSLKLNTRIG